MKMTLIPIVIGALGTVSKGLIQSLKNLEINPLITLSYALKNSITELLQRKLIYH